MKFLIIILSAIIVIGGAVIGLAYAGKINIAGITPKKAAQKPAPQPTEATTNETNATSAETQKSTEGTTSPPPATEPDKPTLEPPKTELTRADGTERVAKLWSTMDPEALSKVLEKWSDGDVLSVLAKMDDKKLSALLGTIAEKDPNRAARISQGIKALEKGGQ